jgi:SAM-dependent methyltransferase
VQGIGAEPQTSARRLRLCTQAVAVLAGKLTKTPVEPVLIAVSPANSEFDVYSGDYNDRVNRAIGFAGPSVDFFTRVKVDYFVDFIAKHAGGGSGTAVLDVGCGTGNSHSLLVPHVARLCAIDISASSIEIARTRNPQVEYATYDGVHVPHPDATFDFAAAVCVFHHVPLEQRLALVSDIRRALKPGGFIVIFEHNPLNPLTMRVVNRCEFDRDAILLRSTTCEALLEDGRFDHVETRFILNVPPFNRIMRAIDARLSKLPTGAQYYTAGQK